MNKPTTFFITENDAPAKREIMVAALHLFVEQGLCETSIRNIADYTGYTNPVLYKHFVSKDELALYLFESCYRKLLIDLKKSMEPEDSFEAKLKAYVEKITVIYDEYPEVILYVTENLRRFWPQVSAAQKKYTLVTQMRELLSLGVDQGVIDKKADLSLLALTINGAMAQLARQLYFKDLAGNASQRSQQLYEIFIKLSSN